MSKQQTLDCLAVAPHPDDVEIFCGGTIITLSDKGHSIGLIDLTRGEMASRGTVEGRKNEAKKASTILGLSVRENLGLPDALLSSEVDTEYGRSHISAVVEVIRKYKPKVLLAPYWQGRHPDHIAASDICTKAVFYAAMKNFAPEKGEPHTVSQTLYYQLRYEFRPSFLVDISGASKRKMEAIECFHSQIDPDASGSAKDSGGKVETLISSRFSLGSIEARDRYLGAMIGSSHAEAFLVKTALPINDPVSFFNENPANRTLVFPHMD